MITRIITRKFIFADGSGYEKTVTDEVGEVIAVLRADGTYGVWCAKGEYDTTQDGYVRYRTMAEPESRAEHSIYKCDGNHALRMLCLDRNCWHAADNPVVRMRAEMTADDDAIQDLIEQRDAAQAWAHTWKAAAKHCRKGWKMASQIAAKTITQFALHALSRPIVMRAVDKKELAELRHIKNTWDRDVVPVLDWAQGYLTSFRNAWAGHNILDALKQELLARDETVKTLRAENELLVKVLREHK